MKTMAISAAVLATLAIMAGGALVALDGVELPGGQPTMDEIDLADPEHARHVHAARANLDAHRLLYPTLVQGCIEQTPGASTLASMCVDLATAEAGR